MQVLWRCYMVVVGPAALEQFTRGRATFTHVYRLSKRHLRVGMVFLMARKGMASPPLDQGDSCCGCTWLRTSCIQGCLSQS